MLRGLFSRSNATPTEQEDTVRTAQLLVMADWLGWLRLDADLLNRIDIRSRNEAQCIAGRIKAFNPELVFPKRKNPWGFGWVCEGQGVDAENPLAVGATIEICALPKTHTNARFAFERVIREFRGSRAGQPQYRWVVLETGLEAGLKVCLEDLTRIPKKESYAFGWKATDAVTGQASGLVVGARFEGTLFRESRPPGARVCGVINAVEPCALDARAITLDSGLKFNALFDPAQPQTSSDTKDSQYMAFLAQGTT